MSANTYDDSGLQAALREYLDIRKNIKPAELITKKALSVVIGGSKTGGGKLEGLIQLYMKAAPSREEIMRVGFKAKVRPRIKGYTGKSGKGLTRAQMVKKELAARAKARMLTATGWFASSLALGGKSKPIKARGERLGSIQKNLSGLSPSITMINGMPGAEQTDDRAGGAMQKALDAVTEDMQVYIERKHDEAARKAGL